MFPNLKNYFIALLVGLLIICGLVLYMKSMMLAKADQTIKEQDTTIATKNLTIAEYKKNIQDEKEHRERVVVIEKKARVIQRQIDRIVKTEELTDEEKDIAGTITDMFNNGLQSGRDGKAGASGEVVYSSGKSGIAKTADGKGTAQ